MEKSFLPEDISSYPILDLYLKRYDLAFGDVCTSMVTVAQAAHFNHYS